MRYVHSFNEVELYLFKIGPVAGSSRGIATSLPRQARGSSKKKVVNPDAMDLGEATRVLRVSSSSSSSLPRQNQTLDSSPGTTLTPRPSRSPTHHQRTP